MFALRITSMYLGRTHISTRICWKTVPVSAASSRTPAQFSRGISRELAVDAHEIPDSACRMAPFGITPPRADSIRIKMTQCLNLLNSCPSA